ncbi:hypothetical protein ACF061_08425 [Streptomyces sp. NPDC015220]|uniref:hypothetical protein n=1 Tax=Streptomyces sp. NPDC015220 TaxID=3364947 RepID=UPI003702C039
MIPTEVRELLHSDELHRLPRWETAGQPTEGCGPRKPPTREIPSDDGKRAARIIGEQLERARSIPAGVAYLLLLVLEAVEEAWEVSYLFHPLWDTLTGARECVRGDPLLSREDHAARATQAALALIESLDSQIRAEDAMVSGVLEARADAADNASKHAQRAIDAVDEIPETFSDDIRTHIEEYADCYQTCYAAVAEAARGLSNYYRHGAPLETVIHRLHAAECDDVMDPVMASELRANRVSLAALHAQKDARWLHVEHGELVYIYPFSVRSDCMAPECVVEEAKKVEHWEMVGVETKPHTSLDLDDIWASDDPLQRWYGGVYLETPDVLIKSADGAAVLTRLKSGIVISNLGNHYVRFSTELEGVPAFELFAKMLYAAPECGELCVMFERNVRPLRWHRLCDLAVQMVMDLGAGENLDLTADTADRVSGSHLRIPPGSPLMCRRGMYQVVASIGAASTSSGPVRERDPQDVLSVGELIGAMGTQVLTNPVPCLVGSPAEWARYATLNSSSSYLTGSSQEWVARSCNTISLFTVGLPNFVRGTWRAVAELTASLEGLLEGWSNELLEHHKASMDLKVQWADMQRPAAKGRHFLSDILHGRFFGVITGRKAVTSASLRELSAKLDAESVDLDTLSLIVHDKAALFSSRCLVASPSAAAMLHCLLELSDYFKRVEQLFAAMAGVSNEELGTTVDKVTQQYVEEDRNRQAAKVTVVLALLAALGVAGVAQIMEAGSHWYQVHALWLALFVVAFGIGVAVLVRGLSVSKEGESRFRGFSRACVRSVSRFQRLIAEAFSGRRNGECPATETVDHRQERGS